MKDGKPFTIFAAMPSSILPQSFDSVGLKFLASSQSHPVSRPRERKYVEHLDSPSEIKFPVEKKFMRSQNFWQVFKKECCLSL